MIGIIDYGMGNIKAFSNIYSSLNIPSKIVKIKEDFENVDKIILPGVGAFDHAIKCLERSGLLESLNDMVLNEKRPILGVCVGMQIMAKSSEEGILNGLGWIDATVDKFDKKVVNNGNPLPHMGWNSIKFLKSNSLFNDIDTGSRFYFLHSYYFSPANKKNFIASAEYGDDFTCAINHNNIYGVQFHPEKSHYNGVQLLKNFSNL